MKEKKLQVFVSSTFTDLIEERQAAVEAILSSGNIPAGMELFSAGDESQMNVIKRWIDESDVYMLILGARYGSVEPESGKSYTQLEYEYSIEQNKPLFAVVLSDSFIDKKVEEKGKSVLEHDSNKELKIFKELVTSKMVKFCDDKKDIKIAVHETLFQFEYEKKLVGWIRGDNSVNAGLLADEIARLTKENDDLRKTSFNKQNILYNGLTYEELKGILIRFKLHENDEDFDNSPNLFEYLRKEGVRFSEESKGIYTDYKIQELIRFKIVISQKYNNNTGIVSYLTSYYFTDDGHKFYLKALLDNE